MQSLSVAQQLHLFHSIKCYLKICNIKRASLYVCPSRRHRRRLSSSAGETAAVYLKVLACHQLNYWNYFLCVNFINTISCFSLSLSLYTALPFARAFLSLALCLYFGYCCPAYVADYCLCLRFISSQPNRRENDDDDDCGGWWNPAVNFVFSTKKEEKKVFPKEVYGFSAVRVIWRVYAPKRTYLFWHNFWMLKDREG